MQQKVTWSLVAAAFVGACAYWYTSAPTSAADAARYGAECEQWISSEVGCGRKATVQDNWRKKSVMVFEVAVARETGTAADLHLCVVDKAKGTMRKPAAVDQSWC